MSLSRDRRRANTLSFSDHEVVREEKLLALDDDSRRKHQGETEEDAVDSDEEDDPRSLFAKKMPGVMSAEEVQASVDLGRWRTKIGSKMTELRVRRASRIHHALLNFRRT